MLAKPPLFLSCIRAVTNNYCGAELSLMILWDTERLQMYIRSIIICRIWTDKLQRYWMITVHAIAKVITIKLVKM